MQLDIRPRSDLTTICSLRFPARLCDTALIPRHAAPLLAELLEDSPVTLIHGPRQCGKTTLAQLTGEPLGYSYVSFDDVVVRGAARSDPLGFATELPDRIVLNEVQRVPGSFSALKMAVDGRRIPGRFILTGSTNVLLVPNLSDSLAGRMQTVHLHPLSQRELERNTSATFLERLFAGTFGTGRTERLGSSLADRIVAGGYPAALTRPAGRRRSAWYRDYIDS